jgi:hypothetical protein
MLPHDGRGPRACWTKGHRSFLAGAAIDGPSERRLPAAVFSTACRARDVASDTLCRAPPLRDRSLAAPESQARFHRPLVKGDAVHTPGRLPSTSAPSTPLAQGITRSPPPFSRLCRRDPASGARSPRARTSMNSSADEARPALFSAGQTPLVDFCNQTIREHDRWVVRTPISAIGSCLPVAREPVEPKPTDAVDQVTPPLASSRAFRPFRTVEATPAEVSRARGLGLSPDGAPRRDCSRRGLCPNPIGSDTSCREPVTPPAGEAAGIGHPFWTGSLYESTDGGTAFAVAPRSADEPAYAEPFGPPARLSPRRRDGWAACADTTRDPGPPHVILREEERDPLRPRCLPSMGYPAGVGVIHRLFPICGLCPGAFAILALARRP